MQQEAKVRTFVPKGDALRRWGWSARLESAWESLTPGTSPHTCHTPNTALPARVTAVHRTLVEVVSARGVCRGLVLSRVPPLAVGDWVALELPDAQDDGVVVACLPREGVLSRNAAGRAVRSQVLAANVDVVAVVMACGGDFNPARLDRFLVAARQVGTRVIVVLTKVDTLTPEALRETEATVRQHAGDVAVACVSAQEDRGLSELVALLTCPKGRTSAHGSPNAAHDASPNATRDASCDGLPHIPTVVLLGASGVGKSTLTNALLKETRMKTQGVGSLLDKGRHTTTHRELFTSPWGFLLIDTPGLREFQLEDVDEGLEAVFEDIQSLEARCRWRDCAHADDVGCAVREALETGALSAARWQAYDKMRREAAYFHRKGDVAAARAEKQKWKARSKEARRRDGGLR